MRPLRFLLLTALLLFPPASTAQAATYCVAKPGCAGTSQPTLQAALDASLATGPDRIEIGPAGLAGGTYTSSDPLTIQGSGRGVTTLGGSGSILSIGSGVGSSSVSVSDLAIAVGPGAAGSALRLDGAAAQRVDVAVDPGATISVGVEMEDGAVYQQGAVSQFAAGSVGIWARLGSNRIDDTIIDLGGSSGSRGLLADNPDGQTPIILDAQHVTVAGGADSQTGAYAYARAPGQTVVLNVRNSILSGVGHALSRAAPNGSSNINPAYSNFDAAGNFDAGGVGGITSSSTNSSLNPGYVNAAGHDFRLSSSSPLIDTAQPGGLDAGDPTTDLAGTKRILDGNANCNPRRDMGALELAPGSVAVYASANPSAAAPNQRITFDASPSCDPDPSIGIGSYTWAFDDGRKASGPVVSHSFPKAGRHAATLTVTSTVGRSGTATVFTPVNASPKAKRRARKRGSLVLIKARTVTLSAGGRAVIGLRCSGTRRCTGRLDLLGIRPVSESAGVLIMKLGSTRFAIRPNRTQKLRIQLSDKRFGLVVQQKRIRAVVAVRDRDSAGRPRRSTRKIVLKAPTRTTRRHDF
jgi:hypothetical protein